MCTFQACKWLFCCSQLQVKTEHDILSQLAQQTLSFKVPTAKPALHTGAPFVVLSNGAAACIFEIIPGKKAFGVTGQTARAEVQWGFWQE